MNVVFLDIDGVLNSAETLTSRRQCHACTRLDLREDLCWFEQDRIERLNRVTAATGCLYVISSSWRIAKTVAQLSEILAGHGFVGEVIGATPTNSKGPKGHLRGYEIQEWLDANAEPLGVKSFAIVDDDSDMEHLSHRLVKTSWQTGMLDAHADKLIAMLNTGAA